MDPSPVTNKIEDRYLFPFFPLEITKTTRTRPAVAKIASHTPE